MTLEEKLNTLARDGLSLAPPFSIEDLLKSWDRADLEADGYDLTLVSLGMTEERPPWRHHCANLWYFDTECIAGAGSYVTIAERMVVISQGSLPIKNISDQVDFDTGHARIAFDFRGQPIDIACEVNDDWVDAKIFGHFVRLLEESDPTKTYIHYDLGGQDCIIGCVTKAQLNDLIRDGITFEALR